VRVKFNVDTQIIYQIGDPMDRGCAAFMMNGLFEYVNMNLLCIPATVKKGSLPEFVVAAKTTGMIGFGLTMPHKSDIIPLLDECDESSRLFQSVNTVKIVDGRLIGIGLDGLGMGMSIEQQTGSVKGKRVLLIGAGSVSGLIGADLCQRGAASITVVNRTVDKARYVAETIASLYPVKTAFGPLDDRFLCTIAPEMDLVVQCTSLGMSAASGDFDSLDFMAKLPKSCVVADVLYPLTKLLAKAKGLGLQTVNGQGMMLEQQIATMEFRFGITIDRSALLAAEEALEIAITMRELRARRLAAERKL
jgi:shikimate dehydrogenase